MHNVLSTLQGLVVEGELGIQLEGWAGMRGALNSILSSLQGDPEGNGETFSTVPAWAHIS